MATLGSQLVCLDCVRLAGLRAGAAMIGTLNAQVPGLQGLKEAAVPL